jgi:hypothetical protein
MTDDAQPREPLRYYDWLDSHLSIARHYGGIKIDGVQFNIRYDLEGQPLEEVLPKPKRARREKQPAALGQDKP